MKVVEGAECAVIQRSTIALRWSSVDVIRSVVYRHPAPPEPNHRSRSTLTLFFPSSLFPSSPLPFALSPFPFALCPLPFAPCRPLTAFSSVT
jgi:hypothetical protein